MCEEILVGVFIVLGEILDECVIWLDWICEVLCLVGIFKLYVDVAVYEVVLLDVDYGDIVVVWISLNLVVCGCFVLCYGVGKIGIVVLVV